MKIYFAADHAGFEMKEELLIYVRDELGYGVEDCGAYELNTEDDYPEFMHCAASKVSESPENTRAIIFGGSGQGEAMVANKYNGVRAAVYYGAPLQEQVEAEGTSINMVQSTRKHNNANILSIGARFISINEAKEAVRLWLKAGYIPVDRHERRIKKIDILRES